MGRFASAHLPHACRSLCIAALLALFLVLAGQMQRVSANTTVLVTDTADRVDPGPMGCSVTGTGTCTLRDAVIFANATATSTIVVHITVPAGTFTLTIVPTDPDDATTGDLNFTNANGGAIIINGAGSGAGGTFIDGNGTDRVLRVERGVVALNSVTIQNGSVSGATAFGGGIFVASGATLNVSGRVMNNQVSSPSGQAFGGGIYNAGTVDLYPVTLTANTAAALSGAALGGGFYNSGSFDLRGTSTVTSNTVTGATANGGGLYLDSGGFSSNVIIGGNQATNGGGIYMKAGSLTILYTTVRANRATADGGGIFVAADAAIRTSISLTIGGDATADGNSAGGNGGGLYNSGALGLSATIKNNTAIVGTNAQGGGLYHAGTGYIYSSIISNNQAVGGGGIAATTPLSIYNNTRMSGNQATGSAGGGGIFISGGTTTVANSTIGGTTAGTGNSAPNGNGGGIRNQGTLIIVTSLIGYNSALDGGGVSTTSTATITNSTLSGNSAGSGGGGLTAAGTATLTHATLANNSTGLQTTSGTTIRNSIIAYSTGANCTGAFTSGDYNLASDTSCNPSLVGTNDLRNLNPQLGDLANNGGNYGTHALLANSPARDRIPNSGANCPATDQRGTTRPLPAGGLCDIGAFEAAPLTAASLTVAGFPTPVPAGTSGSITVTVTDSFGNTVTSYTGTIRVTATDGQASLPADYTFTFADRGSHTFTNGVTLKTAGSQTITATDTVTATITGSQTNITVTAGTASSLSVSGFPNPATAGAAGTVTVTAKDAYGNTATGYTGTVTFTSDDPQAIFPSNYTFTTGTGGDNGTHAFTNGVTLQTTGTKRIIVTDTISTGITGTQANITVRSGPATTLIVNGFPGSITAGTPGSVTVTAKDAYGNTATTYTGTVRVESDDPQAALPAAYTFTNGTGGDNGIHAFAITLKTAGNARSISVTDNAVGSVNGSQTGITVTPAAASAIALTGFPTTVTAGASGNGNFTIKDAYGNTATYSGTLRFTSSDSQAALPADSIVNGGSAGTFAATLKTAGTQSITASGSPGSISGTLSGISVTPAAASVLLVSGFPSPVVAGTAGSVTVTAKDAYGNTATGYTGTVRFTSTDADATFPAEHTFTIGASADNGSHTFTNGVTFAQAGTQTITATSTGGSPITGTQSGIVVKPLLATISPASGSINGGGTVTLTGAGFATGMTVSFGSMSATTVTVNSRTQATVTVPAHGAGKVNISVTVNGQSATLTDGYTYGTVNTLPGGAPPSGPSTPQGPANPLPGSRPSSGSGSPSPLPGPRPS